MSASNIGNPQYPIHIASSKGVTVSNSKITNNSSAAGTALKAIFIGASQGININNTSISNNTAATAFTGVEVSGAGNKNIYFNSAEITANTATNGDLMGIMAVDTNHISIDKTNVTSNVSTAANNVRGFYAGNADNVKFVEITNSSFSSNSVTNSATTTGKQVVGVHLKGVSNGVQLDNVIASGNTGTGQAHGFYIESTPNVQMSNCTASRNAAATAGAADHTGGIEAKISTGLFLWKSDYAHVSDSSFNNNLSGNRAIGDGPNVAMGGAASTTINALTSCSAAGIANIGTSNTNFNKGNTFTNVTAMGNGTQLANSAPSDAGMPDTTADFNDASGTKYHWQSEAIAAGALEQNTTGSTYLDSKFNNNGLTSDYVVSYGIAAANDGTTNNVKTLSLNNVEARNNGVYGFHDENSTTFAGNFLVVLLHIMVQTTQA